MCEVLDNNIFDTDTIIKCDDKDGRSKVKCKLDFNDDNLSIEYFDNMNKFLSKDVKIDILFTNYSIKQLKYIDLLDVCYCYFLIFNFVFF